MVRVGVTMGDLDGIGPEITTKALRTFQGRAEFVAYAPPGLYPEIQGLTYIEPNEPNQALSAIESSARDLRSGVIDGVVTAPVNKAIFEGRYPGHTELYEDLLGANDVAMMMYGKRLKTVPVTTHIALRDVSEALSPELYVSQGSYLVESNQRINLKNDELGPSTQHLF